MDRKLERKRPRRMWWGRRVRQLVGLRNGAGRVYSGLWRPWSLLAVGTESLPPARPRCLPAGPLLPLDPRSSHKTNLSFSFLCHLL